MKKKSKDREKMRDDRGCVNGILHCLREQGCAGGCVGERYTAFGSKAVSEAMLW